MYLLLIANVGCIIYDITHKEKKIMTIENDSNKIHTLSQYVEYVEKLSKDFSVSRGHSKESYLLLPGALRVDKNGKRKYSKRNISYFMNTFKENSHSYLRNPFDIKNDIEWMAMAQHYGLPTRLLDFTDSHIISLLFAVENAFYEEDGEKEDAVVWFMNPMRLNFINARNANYINVDEVTGASGLDNHDGPVAIKCRKLNERINAQSGLFVYFSDSDKKLEDYNDDEESLLKKVVIDKDDKKDILASLYSMGINQTKLYPELVSVVKDIIINDRIKEYVKGEE